jgi:signal transduction histidine kinase/DNA-binding NarL/FixJ family response regulator
MSNAPFKVLLIEKSKVEDSVLVQLSEEKLLFFELSQVEDVEKAIASLQREHFDIILLDLFPYDNEALASLMRLHQNAKNLPIVALVDKGNQILATRVVQEGAQDYLIKGQISRDFFPRFLRHVLDRYRMQLQLEQCIKDLQAYEQKFRSIISANFDGIIVVDQKRAIRFANSVAETIFHRKRENLLHQSFDFPITAGKVKEITLPSTKGATGIIEMHAVETEWEGESAYLISLRDVTAHRQTTKKLLRSEALNQAILSSVTARIVVLDEEKNIIVVNKAWERFTCEHSDLSLASSGVGSNYLEMCQRPESRCPAPIEALHAIEMVFNNMQTQFTLEYSSRIPGEKEWFVMHVTPISDECRGVVVAHHNITQHKQAEQSLREANRVYEEAIAELKAMQQQMIRQESLRMLGEMAKTILHDFNNALSPVLALSEVLLNFPKNLEDREKTIRYLTMINTAAQDAINIAQRLREFYRPHNPGQEAMVLVDLNYLVHQTLSLPKQPKEKMGLLHSEPGIFVDTRLQEIPLIMGNESELQEVLKNLISNAVEAMPYGGTISIQTRREHKYVVLEFSDTGRGMSQQVLAHCMEPFFTTKPNGLGMGLTIVAQIIHRHEATIEIKSEQSQGTTVTIHLPLQEHVSQKISVLHPPHHPGTGKWE